MPDIPIQEDLIRELEQAAYQVQRLREHFNSFRISAEGLFARHFVNSFPIEIRYSDSSGDNIDISVEGRTLRLSLISFREGTRTLATVAAVLLPGDPQVHKPTHLTDFTFDADSRTNITQNGRVLDLVTGSSCGRIAVWLATLALQAKHRLITD